MMEAVDDTDGRHEEDVVADPWYGDAASPHAGARTHDADQDDIIVVDTPGSITPMSGPDNASKRGDPMNGSGASPAASPGALGLLQSSLATSVAQGVFAQTKERATGFFSTDRLVLALRPYFDVEPKNVAERLMNSLIPRTQSPFFVPDKPDLGLGLGLEEEEDNASHPYDLYGPCMLMLTLVALLLYGMKVQSAMPQHVQLGHGTLIGTAFGIAVGYWLLGTTVLYMLALVLTTPLPLLQVACSLGYALFGYCVVLSVHLLNVSLVVNHVAFFGVGGASSLTLAMAFYGTTSDRRHGAICGGVAFALHSLFLLYLCTPYFGVPL